MDYELTKRVLSASHAHSVEYKVFGGVALNLHGLARATEDLDIFVAPNADNIARLRAALRSVFADPEIDQITAEDLLGDYPAIQVRATNAVCSKATPGASRGPSSMQPSGASGSSLRRPSSSGFLRRVSPGARCPNRMVGAGKLRGLPGPQTLSFRSRGQPRLPSRRTSGCTSGTVSMGAIRIWWASSSAGRTSSIVCPPPARMSR